LSLEGQLAAVEEIPHDPGCWVPGLPYQEGTCCDPVYGPRGNQDCWDGLYSFQRCCPPTSEVGVATQWIEGSRDSAWDGGADLQQEDQAGSVGLFAGYEPGKDCWSPGYTYERCCNFSLGPDGDVSCFNLHRFSF
ncbi:unnamed protein product, partial [Polarella glacialis]